MIKMNLFKSRNRLTDIERIKLTVTKGESEGVEINYEFGINRYTLLYIRQTTRTYCRAQGTIFSIL